MILKSHCSSRVRQAGFTVRRVLGRVRRDGRFGARSHLALIVEAGGREWLVDAGFGGPAPALPLLVEHGLQQEVGGIRFRLMPHEASGETVLERLGPDGWFPLYGFERSAVFDTDIEAANFLCARWDQAPFPNHLMLNAITLEGRTSLFDTNGKTERAGAVFEWKLTSPAQLHDLLTGDFRLPVDAATSDAVWQRIAPAGGPSSG